MSAGANRVIHLANAAAAATKRAIELDESGPRSVLEENVIRAIELAEAEDDGFGMSDVMRIKELWEMIEVDLSSFGAVVALRDGRCMYLQYVCDELSDQCVEDLQILPVMPGQRYPEFKGIDINWYDDVTFLNHGLGFA